MPARMTHLRPADYREMPWRNGGGSTTELAIAPAGAELGSTVPFVFRLSMARVETDGPFSRFPGYDRTLILLEGRGVRLDFGGEAAPVTLDTALLSVAFSGDWPTSCKLLDGSVRDFNVMVDRARATAVVQCLALSGPTPTSVELRGHTTLLYVPQGRVVVQLGPDQTATTLTAGEALRRDTEAPTPTTAQVYPDAGPAQLIVVDLTLK